MKPQTLIETVIERLNDAYVFPDRAAEAAALLREGLVRGRYDGDGPAFCTTVSEDLLEATGDKHLRLLWHEAVEGEPDPEAFVTAMIEQFRLENQGFRRIELLEGNIGLIELTLIPPAALAGERIVAAMQLVQDTRALVLDLRDARGGSPNGVAFFVSFFVEDGDVHLNDVITGADGPIRQFWTSAYVPGPRYLDRPVYVVTSGRTFSGGEELAYDLQAIGRATVVGEVTRGGAHPSTVVALSDEIELRLPTARTVNAVTSGNWEGVGVQPDVAVPAAGAVTVAVRHARDGLAADIG